MHPAVLPATTVPLVLTTVIHKKNLVLNVKQENFKMPFKKQIAEVCYTFCQMMDLRIEFVVRN